MNEIPKQSMGNLMVYVGSLGILRASRRHIDESWSIHENYPSHPHGRDEYLTPEEVVKFEIGIWAMGVEYEVRESVTVEVHGMSPLFRGELEEKKAFGEKTSKGFHRVHVGGGFASHVILPFV